EDEVADSDGDAHMTSSPSKGRPHKRHRKNPETEREPQAVAGGTYGREDEEDAEGSRGIVSSSAEARGPLQIEEYQKRITAHRQRLQLFETDRDAAQARINQTDTLREALQEAISNRNIASAKAQKSATSDEANREAEQAEADMAAAQKRVDDHADKGAALQYTVALMQEGVAGCVEDITDEEKDLGAAICLQSLQRVSWKTLRARSVEQVNDLRSLVNDILASGE
ncbi:hypothetical protein NOF04DRAFT_1194119, partial [Fusarium oxysporum II5]